MSDYNFLMESRLSPEQMHVLNTLSRIAAGQGLNLYLVGGAVLDLIHGQPVIRDLDFVVEGHPQRILRALEPSAASKGGKESTGAVPRVASLVYDRRLDAAELHFANGVRAELAASRNEIYSRPGRPPDVEPASISRTSAGATSRPTPWPSHFIPIHAACCSIPPTALPTSPSVSSASSASVLSPKLRRASTGCFASASAWTSSLRRVRRATSNRRSPIAPGRICRPNSRGSSCGLSCRRKIRRAC